jgi:hypothetical protein
LLARHLTKDRGLAAPPIAGEPTAPEA